MKIYSIYLLRFFTFVSTLHLYLLVVHARYHLKKQSNFQFLIFNIQVNNDVRQRLRR